MPTEVLQGTLDLMVLRTLGTMGPQHGFGLAKRILQVSEGVLELNQGTLYPALLRLEERGWIKSRWVEMENGRKRKYYSIKVEGRQALKNKREQWTLISSVLGGLWKGQHV